MTETKKLHAELETAPDMVALEHDVLAWWDERKCFDQLREKNAQGPVFRFLDGPITANNPMGVHHAWGRTLKDVFLRYKALHGFICNWQNGFDAQGLWVEVEVEKELGFASKRDIEAYGIGPFVERCKERVAKYAGVQARQSIRLGQWMDWSNSYFTNTDTNIQGIWHFLRTCHENGWIHRMRMPLTWCPRCGTSLSEHEAAGSHRELTHTAIFAKATLSDGRRALVWTTTPWTLPANVALAVNPASIYCEIHVGDDPEILVVGEEALPFVRAKGVHILRTFPGQELVGLEYDTFFPDTAAQHGVPHRVVAWSDVDPTEGTGIVHIAPGCGAEDFELGKTEGLPTILPIDESGRYVDGFDWLTGMSTGEAAQPIVDALSESGKLFKAEPHTHSYPVCWRCKTETVFRLSEEWFIRSDSVRPRMLAAAAAVRWEPEHVGKRMADWLTNMGDWNISRKRFYGMPLPFYPCAECGETTVIGSKAELLERAVNPEVELPSLHRPWVDEIRIRCPRCSAPVSRVTEVGDVWLDAGIVPFSTLGYFDDRERFQKFYPAEWVTEMREQVRLWFYSMLYMSVTLLDRAPYDRVLSYESVVSEDRRKFSKTGYMIAFEDAAEEMGVDVMRYLFARANVGNSVRFGYNLGDEVRRQLLGLWNAFVFFNTYAALDKPDLANFRPDFERLTTVDAWLLARANAYKRAVATAYDSYDTPSVVREFELYIDDLSNWYIRVNRRRFWRGEDSEDKRTAYWCLLRALRVALQTMAPIIPFVTDALWQKVVRRYDASVADVDSVHLAGWPKDFPVHEGAEIVLKDTAVAREAIALALRLRNEHGLKVRQPLLRMDVVASGDDLGAVERMREVIADQVNVKEVAALRSQEELEVPFLTLDFGVAGPTLKGAVKELKALLAEMRPDDMRTAVEMYDREQPVALPGWHEPLPHKVFQRKTQPREGVLVASGETMTVALDTELPPWLVEEGMVRDLIRQVQVMRKDAGFRVEERIALGIVGADETVSRAVDTHREFIMEQTLARELGAEVDHADFSGEAQVGDATLTLALRRLG
jgi:isoleucyl-tRNA synthetase